MMAYAPNSAAKNLRTLRTGKLLVTVPDISNPFFSLILQGIEDAAQREGHAVLFGDTQHDEQREERYAMMLQRKEADGLIFLGHRLPKSAGDLVRSMAPACAPVVNGCEFNPRLRIPSVHIDNAAAAASRPWIISTRLAIAASASSPGRCESLSRDRLRGATTRARAEGAEQDFVIMHGDFSIESGSIAASGCSSATQRPTAVFCFNDEMALGALNIAAASGACGFPTISQSSASTTSGSRSTWIRR